MAIAYSDPIAALEAIKDNLEKLTDQAIAMHLGWTTNQAKGITEAQRKAYAINTPRDPMAAIKAHVAKRHKSFKDEGFVP